MNFIETIFQKLETNKDRPVLIEIHGKNKVPINRAEFQHRVGQAQTALREAGVNPGDRVVLLAPNSINWAACDLAILSMGVVCVPLYSRQDPKELAFMANDCEPKVFITSDQKLKDEVLSHWTHPCKTLTFDEIFSKTPQSFEIQAVKPNDPVTIVYTSGTSGKPKGAIITCENVDYMLPITSRATEETLEQPAGDDKVFHYLPWCFMGSRIMLWMQLFRGNPLMISTDLQNLPEELKTADPEYFMNVPTLLDRIRNGVTQKLREKGGLAKTLYEKGQTASLNRVNQKTSLKDSLFLALARALVFSKVKQKIGKRLKYLICGSAPLSEQTQRWFEMLGIPVLQVYGLTETTAIVTLDKMGLVDPGRVGQAIEGCETKLTSDGELICRGPNIFPGYWKRPKETQEVLKDGWLYTGDQAEKDENGNWKILGRAKNILIPASGHNIVPEPLEEKLTEALRKVEHVVVVGHGRPFLAAIVTGDISDHEIEKALDEVNKSVPHYRKIRSFYHPREHLTPENGLLTANQKLKRKAIEEYFQEPIEELYRKQANV